MSPELVVTPGGYRPAGVVHRIQPDRKLRILTGRLQGIDSSGQALDDYGSIPRDGGNPALTPGYALPPGLETEEGAEPAPPHGRGWIAYAHWTNEGNQPITSFRSTWTVPEEPATRSGQTVFLFIGMQDSIPMTLVPALQWGPSAAGGGEYWSIASWYVGGTTGAVFYGDLARVAAGDELTARERQVLVLVADGLPNKAIARELGISEHTVKFHVGSLLGKLGAGSRTEAVTLATRRGILTV